MYTFDLRLWFSLGLGWRCSLSLGHPMVRRRGYPLCPQLRIRGSLYLMSEINVNLT